MSKTLDPAINVQEQMDQVKEVSGGTEGVKKKYGVSLKKGGIVCRGQGLARSKKTRMY